jgi:hypothetical protein
MKDGRAIRDRIGLEFQTISGAIEHDKEEAVYPGGRNDGPLPGLFR